jgi:hypothetical protein
VLRPYLVNWTDVVRHFIHSIESDAAADGLDESAALLERLMSYRGVREALRSAASNDARSPVLAMHFRKDGQTLQLFTTIATLGTPQDVTLQELRVECFFPTNDATARPALGRRLRQIERASSSRTAAGRGIGAIAV